MRKNELSMIKRCLRLYHPKFVSFFGARKSYKDFWNDMSLIILKIETDGKRK